MAAGGAIGAEMTNRGGAGLHHPVSVAPRAPGRDHPVARRPAQRPGCSARAWARPGVAPIGGTPYPTPAALPKSSGTKVGEALPETGRVVGAC